MNVKKLKALQKMSSIFDEIIAEKAKMKSQEPEEKEEKEEESEEEETKPEEK